MRRYYTKDAQMTNKHMQSCTTSSVTREMQVKTTPRCHFARTWWLEYKKNHNKRWFRCAGMEPSQVAGRTYNGTATVETAWRFLKSYTWTLTQRSHSRHLFKRTVSIRSYKKVCIYLQSGIVQNSQNKKNSNDQQLMNA